MESATMLWIIIMKKFVLNHAVNFVSMMGLVFLQNCSHIMFQQEVVARLTLK